VKPPLHIGCRPASGLDAAALDRLAAFIHRHGRVPPGRVRGNLGRAFRIAWATLDGELAGVSCLKRPRPNYLKNLEQRLGYALAGFLERGYTCVKPEFQGRGIATGLTRRLSEEAGSRPYYVLAGENDRAITRLLTAGGMIRLRAFDSELSGRRLAFWVSPTGARRLNVLSSS